MVCSVSSAAMADMARRHSLTGSPVHQVKSRSVAGEWLRKYLCASNAIAFSRPGILWASDDMREAMRAYVFRRSSRCPLHIIPSISARRRYMESLYSSVLNPRSESAVVSSSLRMESCPCSISSIIRLNRAYSFSLMTCPCDAR